MLIEEVWHGTATDEERRNLTNWGNADDEWIRRMEKDQTFASPGDHVKFWLREYIQLSFSEHCDNCHGSGPYRYSLRAQGLAYVHVDVIDSQLFFDLYDQAEAEVEASHTAPWSKAAWKIWTGHASELEKAQFKCAEMLAPQNGIPIGVRETYDPWTEALKRVSEWTLSECEAINAAFAAIHARMAEEWERSFDEREEKATDVEP
jgi:hypothetical protein